jgi:hypothetical protein
MGIFETWAGHSSTEKVLSLLDGFKSLVDKMVGTRDPSYLSPFLETLKDPKLPHRAEISNWILNKRFLNQYYSDRILGTLSSGDFELGLNHLAKMPVGGQISFVDEAMKGSAPLDPRIRKIIRDWMHSSEPTKFQFAARALANLPDIEPDEYNRIQNELLKSEDLMSQWSALYYFERKPPDWSRVSKEDFLKIIENPAKPGYQESLNQQIAGNLASSNIENDPATIDRILKYMEGEAEGMESGKGPRNYYLHQHFGRILVALRPTHPEIEESYIRIAQKYPKHTGAVGTLMSFGCQTDPCIDIYAKALATTYSSYERSILLNGIDRSLIVALKGKPMSPRLVETLGSFIASWPWELSQHLIKLYLENSGSNPVFLNQAKNLWANDKAKYHHILDLRNCQRALDQIESRLHAIGGCIPAELLKEL